MDPIPSRRHEVWQQGQRSRSARPAVKAGDGAVRGPQTRTEARNAIEPPGPRVQCGQLRRVVAVSSLAALWFRIGVMPTFPSFTLN